MKFFRSHAWRTRVAWASAAVLLAQTVILPPPARAQRSIISVYVLDFNNKTTVGAQLLGKMAAAQTFLQLRESANWDVVPDAQVQKRMQDLNLKQPFDRVARVQIASGIDAAAVVYGSITEARVSAGATPQAFVRIQVLVEDITSGILIDGAVAEGLSTPRMGFAGDADLLLEEALGKAAFRAREFMDRFRLPEGTVLNTTIVGGVEKPALEALLNVGARQGLRRGMELLVTRLKETVGRMKVTNVDSDISTARVIENLQGVRPEDRVRAVFNFADFPITRTRLRSAVPDPPARLASNAIVATEGDKPQPVVAPQPVRVAKADKGSQFVPFLAPQDGNKTMAQGGVPVPPPVTVEEPEVDREERSVGPAKKLLGGGTLRMLVGGLLVMGLLQLGGRGGTSATRAHGVDAAGFQFQVGSDGAFIRVRWDRPKAIKSSQVLQYVVWRTDALSLPLIVAALDGDGRKQFDDNEAVRTVNAFDGDPGDEAGDRQEIEDVPGIEPGVGYRYQVATAFRPVLEDPDDQQTGGGGGGGGGQDLEDLMSPLSASSPWTTAITPPSILAPVQNQEVQLDDLTVTWQQTDGADTYVIWLSRNSTFPQGSKVAFGPFRVLPVNQGGDPEVTRNFDARSSKLPRRGSPRIYVTVGARNSQDRNKPIPRGAIFSGSVSIRRLPDVPPPPGTEQDVTGKPKKGEGRPKKPQDKKPRGGKLGDIFRPGGDN